MTNYKIFCHVCHKLVDIQAQFVSTRDYTATDEAGMSYPIGTCNAGNNAVHTGEEIRKSYKLMNGGK